MFILFSSYCNIHHKQLTHIKKLAQVLIKSTELEKIQWSCADLHQCWMLLVNINQLKLGFVAYIGHLVGCHCQHVRYTLQH